MTQARDFGVPLPERMQALPVDRRGFPVPAFVKWIDGEPDFRVMDPTHLSRCIAFKRCWICGEKLGRYMTFVIGPMCCVNRVSAEPPSHLDCGRFAAVACPFMSKPLAKRPGIDDLIAKHGQQPQVAGIMIERNPGLSCLWTTKDYKIERHGGVLFRIGAPERIEFYREGRAATRAEVDHSVDTGLPLLLKACHDHNQPEWPVYEARTAFEALLPTYWRQPVEETV